MTTTRNLNLSSYPSDDDDTSASLPPTYAPATDADFYAAAAAKAVTAAVVPQTMTLYLTEPGTTTAISVSDLYQGQIGDCFLISSIGELALNSASSISGMIHATGSGSGSETVTLYEASNGSLPGFGTTSFKAVQESVTNVFPTYSVDNGATQDVVGNQKEIWPQVLEKAVATLDGGYGAIANGGNPMIAMEELTGKTATYVSPGALTLTALLGDVSVHDLIVMDTANSSSLPNGLYGDHAYMFESVTGTGSSAVVHLGNPWGFDQPTPILFSQLSKGIVEVDIGHFA